MKFNYTVFSTSNNYYLYDGVSSNILLIQPSLFLNHKHLFQKICSNTYEIDKQFANEYSKIIEAIDNELLVPVNENPLLYWFETEENKKNFLDQISHLMIGVTEKCNMRCKYCIYSGHYENERIHGYKDIDFLTLKNSLEKFFSISESNNKIINFYGGEPFVNFNSIKGAVEYINKVDSSTQIFITTNGVLLSEEICEWFSINKNVHLYVSFAGLPDIHDKLRVLANGKPTFEIIKENLLRIKNYDKESYGRIIKRKLSSCR